LHVYFRLKIRHSRIFSGTYIDKQYKIRQKSGLSLKNALKTVAKIIKKGISSILRYPFGF
jgi:hypothetical protein